MGSWPEKLSPTRLTRLFRGTLVAIDLPPPPICPQPAHSFEATLNRIRDLHSIYLWVWPSSVGKHTEALVRNSIFSGPCAFERVCFYVRQSCLDAAFVHAMCAPLSVDCSTILGEPWPPQDHEQS